MKKTVLTFGLIAGAVLSGMMLLTMPFEEQIGYDRAEVIGYTTMVAAFLLIFFGIRSYRDNVANGRIRFGRAFAVGALISVTAAACYMVTWEIIYYGIKPEWAEHMKTAMIEKTKASGGTPAEIEAKLAQMQKYAEWYKNPLINVAITFVEPLPLALIISLVSAGILSRRRSDENVPVAAT
jgi:hypothetical protein